MCEHPAKNRAGLCQNPGYVTGHAARVSTRLFVRQRQNSNAVSPAGRPTDEPQTEESIDCGSRRPARRSTRHRRRSPRGASRHRLVCDRGHRRQSERSQTVTPATGAGDTADRAADRAYLMPCLPCLPCLETGPYERRAIPVERRHNTPAAGQDPNRRRLSLRLSPPVCAAVCRRRCLYYRAHVAANEVSVTTHRRNRCSRQGRQGNDRGTARCPVRENRRTAPVLDRADRADRGFSQRCVVYGTPIQRAPARAFHSVSGGFAGAATSSETCKESDKPRNPRRSRRSRETPRRGPAEICVLWRSARPAPTAAHGGNQ